MGLVPVLSRSLGGGTAVPTTLDHVVMYGQSLSLGTAAGGTGSVISSASATHKMFSAGVRVHYDQIAAAGNVNTPVDPDGAASLTALEEQISSQDATLAETLSSGMGVHLTNPTLFSSTGRGAYDIALLLRDTPTNYVHFINTYAAMLYGSLRAEELGRQYNPVFAWKHGEADGNANTTRAAYRSMLLELLGDLRGYAQFAAHVDASAAPMLTDQIAFRHDTHTYGEIAVAVIDMHRAGELICVGPTYDVPFTASNNVHFTSAGYRIQGERWGKVLSSVLDGSGWDPCHITGVSRSGSTLTVSVHVPVGDLVKDTTTFASRSLANDGFNYSGANITGVAITGQVDRTATIEISLDASSGGTLRCAYENATTADFRNEVGSHFRDSNPDVTEYGSHPLYNWLCTDSWVVA